MPDSISPILLAKATTFYDFIPNPVLIPSKPALTPNPSPKLGRGEPEARLRAK
jgi:hypothetical protein